MTSITDPGPQLGDTWVLRSARADDADGLLSLWRAAGAEPTSTDDVDSVVGLIRHDPDALIVADTRGELVGSVVAGFDGWRGNLYRLAVHPRFRRRGLGLALVAEAERRLSARGVRRVNALVVSRHAHAVGFWEAAGYPRDVHMGRHVKSLPGPL